MNFLKALPTRDEVLRHVAVSSAYGNLCLFIGAGFSKELVGDAALSWGKLLESAADEMGVVFDFSNARLIGVGYPEVASLVCRQFAESEGVTFEQALLKLKTHVSEMTCWYPSDEKKSFYAEKLTALAPSWIVTTNYDLVIESLLPVNSVAIGPNQPLVFRKGMVPVYHLHGVRTSPQDIVIAREDYTALFRPNEYRQIKLALTLKESTTLLLGYGLGDDNVLTAFDWSRNVFQKQSAEYPSGVIQVVRATAPKKTPYLEGNGTLILEVKDLQSFFSELMPFVESKKAEDEKANAEMQELNELLVSRPVKAVERFIDDQAVRNKILSLLIENHTQLINGFIPFFEKSVDQTFVRSKDDGAFEGYSQCLMLLLDILIAYGEKDLPPLLFQKIASAFDRQAKYVGSGLGQSHASGRQWEKRKKDLPKRHVRELHIYAKRKSWSTAVKLLAPII